MNLKGKNATFYLSEEGKTFLWSIMDGRLSVFAVGNGQHGILAADVEESEDLGVWLRFKYGGDPKLFLLRWEFILGTEISEDKSNVVGLKR